jgi:hypothetical protein
MSKTRDDADYIAENLKRAYDKYKETKPEDQELLDRLQ